MVDGFKQRSAHARLNKLFWMKSQGCEFSFDIDAEIALLRQIAPEWKPEYGARHAAPNPAVRGGWVQIETDPGTLIEAPLKEIVSRAKSISGRTQDFRVERDPFAGLVKLAPIRALAALRIAAEVGEFTSANWVRFLEDEARNEADSVRFRALIAGRITRLTSAQFSEIAFSVARWFETASETLIRNAPHQFDKVWTRLITYLERSDEANASALMRQAGEIDWATEAINSIAGELAKIQIKMLPTGMKSSPKSLPDQWKIRMDQLFGLGEPSRNYVLVLLSHNLEFFFWYDEKWSRQIFFDVLETNNDPRAIEAIWAGFFWGAKTPNEELYRRLKPYFLEMAGSGTLRRRRHGEVLGGILLKGWAFERRGRRLVSSEELRSVILNADDEFRGHLIWQLDRWSSEPSWMTSLPCFLRDVWPKQKKARTPRVSGRLIDLLLHHPAEFEELAPAVLAVVGRIGSDSLSLLRLARSDAGLVQRYPVQILEMLHVILPEDVLRWPYEASGLVRQLAQDNPDLARNPRLLGLLSRTENI